jgi:hypothetical protein
MARARHLACAFALGLAALAPIACGGSEIEPAAATGEAGASEVVAEPVASAGENPFTAPAGTDTKGIKPPPAAVGMGGPASYRGGLPGLYGGTRDYATCDAAKLIAFLEENPDKAAAWADTLGIEVTRIRRYVSHLTPVLLRTDTRVTNHGYVNGRATPIQAVLQAGTAVFVDDYGRPVVKCYCGNPLTAPKLYQAPVYVGPRWTGFTTSHITIINKSVTIINNYTLYDPRTGRTFVRPAGTSGEFDGATGGDVLPPQMDPNTTPSTPPPTQQTPPPPQATTPQAPPDTPPAQPAAEKPSAGFTPNPGEAGETFTLGVNGFRPGARLEITLTRPDGHVEHYSFTARGDGTALYTFPGDPNVITGTYNATVTNTATGAAAHTSVQVLPRAGG